MDSRFIFPEEFSAEDITLFSIMDSYDFGHMGVSKWFWSRGFGVNWLENQRQLLQVFGYRVGTIAEMEAHADMIGKDEGGYDYFCYKTRVFDKDEKLITDGVTKFSKNMCSILGARHHTSRYEPQAKEEAMCMAYKECKREAEKISQRLSKKLVEIIHEDIRWELGHCLKEYYGDTELIPPIMKPDS